MEKGQIQAQVLIYVLAIIIASSILLYGYTVVRSLMTTQEDILLLNFERDFSSKVREKSYEFRSVEKTTFTLPNQFDEVCFADLRFFQQGALAAGQKKKSLIADSLTEGVSRNVFLLKGRLLREAFEGGIISLEDQDTFDCFPVYDGRVNILFEAKGKTVEIRSWQ